MELDIMIDVEDIQLKLGGVALVGSSIKCKEVPFKAKYLYDSEEFAYRSEVIAYSHCTDVVFLAYNLFKVKTEQHIFCLIKLSIANILREKIEYIVDENPKKILGIFIQELDKYSKEEGGFDYGELFRFSSPQH